jgi:hypothetical protein
MLAVTGGLGTITPGGGGVGPTTGWTELFDQLGTSNNVHVALWARCVQPGEGKTYDFGVTNGNLQSNGCYIVEIAT